ncbi:hypothetical protein NHG85_18440, partial [Limimaricola sp. ASW11-118]|nr:hypothetical protein [Limimaricola litoreus]
MHSPDPERSRTALALARHLEEEREPVTLLLTAAARQRDAPRNVLQWPPFLDSRAATQTFLGRWRPDLLLWIRGPLQPALLSETARAGIPALMVDAEAETATLAGGRWRPGARRAAFAAFERIL